MPHYIPTKGLYLLASQAITPATDIRVAALKGTTPTLAIIRDLNTLADVIATTWDEAAVAGYARADLASVAVTENDAGDAVTITAAAPTMPTVAAGETWVAMAYYIHDADDALAEILSIDVPSSPVITNGSSITLPALSITVAAGVGS
jgi:hypothetical protein